MDDFNAYRAMCANRLRRLERYKKARSFCSLEEEGIPHRINTNVTDENQPVSAPAFCQTEAQTSDRFFPSSPDSSKENQSNPAFEMIREKMFSLMENDMSLLQQLLSLGDQISEMKQRGMRKCQSTTSLDEKEDEEMEDHFDDGFSASMSAVTNLYVDDGQPQYFSRQNSVLRIPIPPRASNRFGSRKQLPRRPSDALRKPRAVAAVLHIHPDDTASESSEGPTSPSDLGLPYSDSTVSSKASVTYSASTVSVDSVPTKITQKNRSSNSSIDSGIRESSSSASPSPTFEREVI